MKNTLLNILIAGLIMACASEIKDPEQRIETDYKAELLKYFENNYSTTFSNAQNAFEFDSLRWIETYYKNNNYSLIWINDSIEISSNGLQFLEQLSLVKNYGLDSSLFSLFKINETKNSLERIIPKQDKYALASDLDIMLSYNYMLFGMHLNYGILDSTERFTELPRRKFRLDLPAYLQNAYLKDSIIGNLFALQPRQIQYQNLQKGLEKFLSESSLSTENIFVPIIRQDSIEAIKQAKKALILHGYLPNTYSESEYHEALVKFQQDHGLKPDSLIGQNTAKALSVSPYNYYKRIVANIEKWKWKENWSRTYLYVNIPSYQLGLFQDQKLIRTHKVVVGKFKNQTPEMADSIEYLVAYPYWNVPKQISVREILPKAQKDPTYLDRNNYEVLDNNRLRVATNSVNWKSINATNFNYYIRQKGGASNALGMVKFIFPNKRAIYLHDTPTKHFFDFETRAYSHGCVRVQNAVELAEYILSEDGNKYNLDSIQYYIKKQEEKAMALNTKLPIYLYYNTVTADSLGNLTFYNDVYGLDKKLIDQLTFKGDNGIGGVR